MSSRMILEKKKKKAVVAFSRCAEEEEDNRNSIKFLARSSVNVTLWTCWGEQSAGGEEWEIINKYKTGQFGNSTNRWIVELFSGGSSNTCKYRCGVWNRKKICLFDHSAPPASNINNNRGRQSRPSPSSSATVVVEEVPLTWIVEVPFTYK